MSYIQLTYLSYDNYENMCTLSYHHHQSMTHLSFLGLGHEKWYAPYVFLYSYEFVIWLDCFVGHSCPGGFCPGFWSLVTDMQHYYFAMYPTDDWHLANMFHGYNFPWFCVWEGCFIILLAHGECLGQFWLTPTPASSTRKKNKPWRGWYPAPHLSWVN